MYSYRCHSNNNAHSNRSAHAASPAAAQAHTLLTTCRTAIAGAKASTRSRCIPRLTIGDLAQLLTSTLHVRCSSRQGGCNHFVLGSMCVCIQHTSLPGLSWQSS